MSQVNYMITKDALNVSFDGQYHTIKRGDSRYARVVEAIKQGNLTDIPTIVDLSKGLEIGGLILKDGIVMTQEGEALPAALNERIIEFRDEGLPFEHLLKFWENLKQNPSFRAREQLFKFLEHNGHPLTEDGCFVAYRGVTEDFKDIHTKTFNNAPGSICEMPREQVDDDPTRTCSAGLHVAAWEYASGFGPQKVEVKINPKDVVAVPIDYNGQKMRVCKFEVLKACEKPIENQALYGRENEFTSDEYESELEDSSDESEISSEDREEILRLSAEFSDRYSGDALVTRISEETWISESDIETVLNEEGAY
jgi:hypothetical protein